MIQEVLRLLAPLARRVRLIVSRAVLTAPADDSGGSQKVDVALLADEEREGVARVQQYGLTSVPPKDAEAVCLSVGGVRDHLVVVAVDDSASRPTGLKEGEVALWTKKAGVRVKAVDDGHVDLGTNPTDPVALAPVTRQEFDKVKQDLDAIKQWAASHTHQAGPYLAAPTTVPLVLAWSPGDIAAEEVRAK